MRITSITVNDFKGVRHAELVGLDAQPFTVMTGQNGTGKSAMLQAVQLLARLSAPEPDPDLVRLGTEQTEIAMSLSLSDDQFELVDRYHRSTSGRAIEQEEQYIRAARLDKAGNVTFFGSEVAALVFDPVFRRNHNFPGVNLIQAERGRIPQPGLVRPDPGGPQPSGPVNGFVSTDYLTSSLTALDYRSLLDTRQGEISNDDYAELTQVFYEATGKLLSRPQLAEGFDGFRIEVEIGDGNRHGLSGLSSGEFGLLALLCALYRSAANGDILLLDEPDLHLHPILQTAFLRTVRTLATQTQTIIVTHSVKIVSATHPSQAYQICHDGPNQARHAADASSLVGVIADMGIEQADLLTKACQLVVEGQRDEVHLTRLFPHEMERVHLEVAGDCKQVLAHYRLLANGLATVPWMCLIDRDLMTESDAHRLLLTHPNLHIWPRRALESLLLDPALLAETLRLCGRPTSLDEAEGMLRTAADHLIADVVTDMLHAALAREFPPPQPGHRSDQGLKEFYAANARTMQARANAVEAIRRQLEDLVTSDWEQLRFALVDPKKTLGRLTAQLHLFRKTEDLTLALIARAAQDPTVRPAGLEEFRVRLVNVMGDRPASNDYNSPG